MAELIISLGVLAAIALVTAAAGWWDERHERHEPHRTGH
jgi:hypothetical protein